MFSVGVGINDKMSFSQHRAGTVSKTKLVLGVMTSLNNFIGMQTFKDCTQPLFIQTFSIYTLTGDPKKIQSL